MISGSNEQLQLQLEYILLKPDCHSWWISKNAIWTLEERYAIKFCFKLGKKCHTMKVGSTAITQRPKDRFPSGSMLALPDPRSPDRGNPPTNFWWSLFCFFVFLFSVRIFRNLVVGYECFLRYCAMKLVPERCLVCLLNRVVKVKPTCILLFSEIQYPKHLNWYITLVFVQNSNQGRWIIFNG